MKANRPISRKPWPRRKWSHLDLDRGNPRQRALFPRQWRCNGWLRSAAVPAFVAPALPARQGPWGRKPGKGTGLARLRPDSRGDTSP